MQFLPLPLTSFILASWVPQKELSFVVFAQPLPMLDCVGSPHSSRLATLGSVAWLGCSPARGDFPAAYYFPGCGAPCEWLSHTVASFVSLPLRRGEDANSLEFSDSLN